MRLYKNRKNPDVRLRCSSMIKHLPSMCKVLGSIPEPNKKRKKKAPTTPEKNADVHQHR
jgi:hypothetical protein